MNKENILLSIFIISVVIIIYVWYSQGLGETIITQTSSPELEQRLKELRHLKEITLDTSIFEDPFFASLKLPAELPPLTEDIGRENPFITFETNR